jgi:hypothetical protein
MPLKDQPTGCAVRWSSIRPIDAIARANMNVSRKSSSLAGWLP